MNQSEAFQIIGQASSESPELTVVVPFYNAALYLDEMLESVLQQQGVAFEVVLIDDASTDVSLSVAMKWMQRDARITLGTLAVNRGPAHARNCAAALSRSEWLCPFDADDVMLPQSLSPYFDYVRYNDSTFWGYCGLYIQSNTETGPAQQMINHFDFIRELERNILCHGMCLVKKRFFDLVGGYNASLRTREDYDFFLRLMEYADPVFYARATYLYRRHEGNISRATGRDVTASYPHMLLRQRLLSDTDEPVVRLRRECMMLGLSLLDADRNEKWNDAAQFAAVLRQRGVISHRLDMIEVNTLVGHGEYDAAWRRLEVWFCTDLENEDRFVFEQQRAIEFAIRVGLKFPVEKYRSQLESLLEQAWYWKVDSFESGAYWLRELQQHMQ
ncbi:MAG: glycosyltransferase family 2 protein [Spartobacteria bacterium]|nr:glycosyltransferase family 2 protein [Spartobacteria bacterium]